MINIGDCVKIIVEDVMNLFKIDNFQRTNHSWGFSDEFFIYPVGSSYDEKDFKIRISRIEIINCEDGFDRNVGIKRFLVPINKNLAIKFNETKMLIRKESTFRFKGEDKVESLNDGKVFNLMLSDELDGKLEVVKFKDRLIVKDDFNNDKILFCYNLRDELKIESVGKSLTLNKDEFAVIIPSGKYEINFTPSTDNNAIIWGKVIL